MSPYRTAPLVLSVRRTGAARLRRRVFRAWIAVLTWWYGHGVRVCHYQSDLVYLARSRRQLPRAT